MLETQFLTTKFEDLRMHEYETISEFNASLCDISNEAFALEETFSTELIRKILRSLPDRSLIKATGKEIDTFAHDGVINSLIHLI